MLISEKDSLSSQSDMRLGFGKYLKQTHLECTAGRCSSFVLVPVGG